MASLFKWLRPPDWSVYALVLCLILFHAMKTTDEVAPITPPELGEALPGVQPTDQSVLVEIEQRVQDGSGTAFAIDDDGTWLTARHVIDGCDQVALIAGALSAVKVDRMEVSQVSDIAVLHTRWNREPLASDINTQRTMRELGFFFGFPQGRPGEVAGSLLGRHQLITKGRYSAEEAIFAWAELSRTRGLSGSLGGLSGGPAFDADGEVIGVVAAESPRRGRVYTVAPSSLTDVVPAKYDKARSPDITLDTFGTEADRYRRDRRIAQVICLVD